MPRGCGTGFVHPLFIGERITFSGCRSRRRRVSSTITVWRLSRYALASIIRAKRSRVNQKNTLLFKMRYQSRGVSPSARARLSPASCIGFWSRITATPIFEMTDRYALWSMARFDPFALCSLNLKEVEQSACAEQAMPLDARPGSLSLPYGRGAGTYRSIRRS